MRKKKEVLEFLNDNYGMINSLMCGDERKVFRNDVVIFITKEIERQIRKDEKNVKRSYKED